MFPLQEKFQVIGPEVKEPDSGWASQGSALRADPMPRDKFNVVSDANSEGTNGMPFSLAGCTDQSCEQVSAESLGKGFQKVDMKGCDDQYTGEHIDHFYGDAGGFAERNNYLDRM